MNQTILEGRAAYTYQPARKFIRLNADDTDDIYNDIENVNGNHEEEEEEEDEVGMKEY